MANTYRVCSGNTAIDITVTLTQGSCVFWYDVYQDYYTNEYYRRQLTVTLSQASPTSFTYNYGVGWTIDKNGAPYSSGYNSYSITIPAGVTTYSWYMVCSSQIGQTVAGDYNPDRLPVEY